MMSDAVIDNISPMIHTPALTLRALSFAVLFVAFDHDDLVMKSVFQTSLPRLAYQVGNEVCLGQDEDNLFLWLEALQVVLQGRREVEERTPYIEEDEDHVGILCDSPQLPPNIEVALKAVNKEARNRQ